MATLQARKVILREGVPVVVDSSQDRAQAAMQHDVEAAEAILRSGLPVWMPSSSYMALLDRMQPQGALANVPPRQTAKPGTSGWGSPYIQFDDSPEAEGPPVYSAANKPYDSRTCAQRHDDEFKALKMEVELLGRRLEKLEKKLAEEWKISDGIRRKLEAWEADS